jgi:hypothetical protein
VVAVGRGHKPPTDDDRNIEAKTVGGVPRSWRN